MPTSSSSSYRPLCLLLCVSLFLLVHFGCVHKSATSPSSNETASFTVDGKNGLASLIALSNEHIKKFADGLSIFAMSSEARSGKWSRIRNPLGEIGKRNIAAVSWFALPDGSYWTVDQGKVEGSLTDRSYWKKVVAGQVIIGELVVSKSTGQNVAIIAIPVLHSDHSLAGVLGASIYLDKFSQQIKQEMALDDNYLFYAIDSTTQIALNSNTDLIFLRPGIFGDELRKLFDEMVKRQEGVVTYPFKGVKRTVLFRKSPDLNWWYAIGKIMKE